MPGLAEEYAYYISMVGPGSTFDALGNEYGDRLPLDEQKALGNALGGELATALGIPWPVALNGARAAHWFRAIRKRRLPMGLDAPNDAVEESDGYLDYLYRLRRQCKCEQ